MLQKFHEHFHSKMRVQRLTYSSAKNTSNVTGRPTASSCVVFSVLFTGTQDMHDNHVLSPHSRICHHFLGDRRFHRGRPTVTLSICRLNF